MKTIYKGAMFCLVLLAGICFCQAAAGARTLELSRDVSVLNTGTDEDRTALLDIRVGNAHDVNGLVFTLVYDANVFSFEGLEKGDMEIDDGSGYDPDNPPSAQTISETLYYQANNIAESGIVMIAAAAADFFTDQPSDIFTAFRAKFKVNSGAGNGTYPIRIQKTIIGPDTAAPAGYTVATTLEPAAGLAPDAEPETAQTYNLDFVSGLVTVTGGYRVAGSAVYGSVPETPVDPGKAVLIKASEQGHVKFAEQQLLNGAFEFTGVPSGTYRVEVTAARPRFQKRHVSAPFDIDGDDLTLPKAVLAENQAKSGTITINGSTNFISGLRIEVRDGSRVISTAMVNENGRFVTLPLEMPLPDTVRIYAVYGTAEQDITGNLTFDWTGLPLGTVSGHITGLCPGQLVEVLIRSNTAKIQKAVMVEGAQEGNDYTLANLLPADDYNLSVTGEGVAVFYEDAQQYSDAADVTVTAGTETADMDFSFSCDDIRTISGKVEVNGEPGAGLTVKAGNFDFTDWLFGSAVTGPTGEFEIMVAASDDYYVYIEHNRIKYYHNTGANAVTSRSDAAVVDVSAAPAEDIDILVDIPVPDTAGLEGYVTVNRSMEDNGSPLENYLIVLTTPDNVPVGFFARTDSDGYYLFENVPPGTYGVSLRPPAPYAPQAHTPVELVNEDTQRCDFIVDQYFRVIGSVKDLSDGTSVPDARVDIFGQAGKKARSGVRTDIEGLYRLYDIPSGVYALTASHPEFKPEGKTGVQVISNMMVDDIELSKGSSVSGEVQISDTEGTRPLKGALVTLRGPDYVKIVRTGADGTYRFTGLAENADHMIKVSYGNIPYDPDAVVTGNIGSALTHDMTLVVPLTAWTFGGVVTDAGDGVTNAFVLLHSQVTGYRKVVRTDQDGGFVFTGVVQGSDYSLLVLPGDNKPVVQHAGISITSDRTDYPVVLPEVVTISGTITLSEPAQGITVMVGAYDPVSNVTHETAALNPVGDALTFTYTVRVETEVAYKVFAYDAGGMFPLRYHAADQDQTTGLFEQATDVTGNASDVNIALTR